MPPHSRAQMIVNLQAQPYCSSIQRLWLRTALGAALLCGIEQLGSSPGS